MNILEAYVDQSGYFNVIFSSVDYELLKEIILNLSQDFNAEFIDLFPIMTNMEDIDNDRVKELLSFRNPVKFIIVPVFPLKYIKVGVSYHINISLNYKLINERNINKDYVNLEAKYKEQSMINKYINLTKYVDDKKKLEDDIFNIIIYRIKKKLDDGKYEDRLKKEKMSEKEEENSEEKMIEKEEKDKKEEKLNEFKTEKLVSKSYDHDAKEEYLDKANEPVDNKILEDMDDTSDPLNNMSDNVTLEDVNMDDEMDPVNDYSSMDAFEVYNHDQEGGIRTNIIEGTRVLKRVYGVVGYRILR